MKRYLASIARLQKCCRDFFIGGQGALHGAVTYTLTLGTMDIAGFTAITSGPSAATSRVRRFPDTVQPAMAHPLSRPKHDSAVRVCSIAPTSKMEVPCIR